LIPSTFQLPPGYSFSKLAGSRVFLTFPPDSYSKLKDFSLQRHQTVVY